MPSVVMEVPEQYDSISRSLQRSIIEHVRKITGLPVNTVIQNNPQERQTPQGGSNMEDMDEFGGAVKFQGTDKITTNCREEFIQEATLTSTVRRPEHRTVFEDVALGVALYPSYQYMKMTMDFEIRFKDRASADNWYSGFQRALSQRRAQQTHTVVYHYPIPEVLLVILQEIHRLRETQGGYGQTLTEYVSEFGSPNLTSIVNQAGNNETVVQKETQHEIVGHFDFESAVPRPEPNTSDGTYLCSFTYEVEFQKPISVVMKYPNTVHNQLMPFEMIEMEPEYDVDRLLAASGSLGWETQRQALRENRQYIPAGMGAKGMRIPAFDDWLPKSIHPGEGIVFTALIHVDPNEPDLMMSLKELGHFELDPLMVAFLEEDPQALTTLLGSPLKLYMYQGGSPRWGDEINVSQDLTVRSVAPMDIRTLYHVVLTLYYDIKELTTVCKERMRRHGEFTVTLMECLSSQLRPLGLLPTVRADGSISKAEFDRAADYLHARRNPPSGANYSGLRLVGAMTIDARQKGA